MYCIERAARCSSYGHVTVPSRSWKRTSPPVSVSQTSPRTQVEHAPGHGRAAARDVAVVVQAPEARVDRRRGLVAPQPVVEVGEVDDLGAEHGALGADAARDAVQLRRRRGVLRGRLDRVVGLVPRRDRLHVGPALVEGGERVAVLRRGSAGSSAPRRSPRSSGARRRRGCPGTCRAPSRARGRSGSCRATKATSQGTMMRVREMPVQPSSGRRRCCASWSEMPTLAALARPRRPGARAALRRRPARRAWCARRRSSPDPPGPGPALWPCSRHGARLVASDMASVPSGTLGSGCAGVVSPRGLWGRSLCCSCPWARTPRRSRRRARTPR